PQLASQLFARHNFTRALEQQQKHAEGLIGKSHARAVMAQLSGEAISLEVAEASGAARNVGSGHGGRRLQVYTRHAIIRLDRFHPRVKRRLWSPQRFEAKFT